MKNLDKYIISPQTTIKQAIKQINSTGKKSVFILGEDKTLLGLFCDEDMRKYILLNSSLDLPVTEAMNTNPTVYIKDSLMSLEQFILVNRLLVCPIVDENNHLVDAVFWGDIESHKTEQSIVSSLPESISTVIMAGGLGKRLYPYTKVLPKALIPIGDLPICTHVINSFKKYGCNHFHLILNYKKDILKAFYNNTEKDYQLQYHEEKEFLGTGGGLYLLKDTMTDTFFISNCDILVDIDYSSVYQFHKKENNIITLVGALKEVEIPYGIIKTDASSTLKMEEKPSFSFLTNVGVYLVEPQLFDLLEDGEFIHMPDLVTRHIEKGHKVGVFPVHGDAWLDMGQIEEMKHMQATLEKQMQKKNKN